MTMWIRNCTFTAHEPSKFFTLWIHENTASCGYCSELIYINCAEITDHHFESWHTRCKWTSQTLGMVIHLCNKETAWSIAELLAATPANK